MATQIIAHDPERNTETPKDNSLREGTYLWISEFFCDTIQGEGVSTGMPAAFLRVSNCHFNCKWCDTRPIHRMNHLFTFDELITLMKEHDLPDKLSKGQRLIFTGGSPLLQQDKLLRLMQHFFDEFRFYPYIEIENETTIIPHGNLVWMTKQWNNSPKLSNSGIKEELRYIPEVISYMAALQNSWFKFVISSEDDMQEVLDYFVFPGYVHRTQIILMPEGQNRRELEEKREMVMELAIQNNMRYSSREQIVLWDTKIGV